MRHVNALAVAKACNLTAARVHQLVAEGMPKLGRGKFELVACLSWYVRYLQRIVEQRSDTGAGAGTLAVERAALAREQRMQLAYRNTVTAGELGNVHELARDYAGWVANAITRLSQVAGSVAQNFDVGVAPKVRGSVAAAINVAIAELREHSLREAAKADREDARASRRKSNGENDDAG